MSNDNKNLDRAIKSLEKKASTSLDKKPWQELLPRRSTIVGPDSLQSVKFRGGSWFLPNSIEGNSSVTRTKATGEEFPDKDGRNREFPIQENLLGKPTFPEINFVPYNFRTNANITSLVGHPISYSVVGPTIKNPDMDWQWKVTDNSSIPSKGDELDLSPGPGGAQSITTFEEGYNVADVADVNGGLYLYVSVVGDEGVAPVYLTDQVNQTPLKLVDSPANTGALYRNRWELFKIIQIAGSKIYLSTEKRLKDYFFFDPAFTTHYVRAVTVFKPLATRLVAVPGSGKRGQETTFAVVPPEKAAGSEMYPSFLSWGGDASSWGGDINIPIPSVSSFSNGFSNLTGQLVKTYPGSTEPLESEGTFKVVRINDLSNGWTPSADDVGKVINIHSINSKNEAQVQIDSPNGPVSSYATPKDVQGWYEILSLTEDDADHGNLPSVTLKRVIDFSPVSGKTTYGPGPYSEGPDATAEVEVTFTVHDPIKSLWTSPVSDLEKLNQARLVNLLDPTQIERGGKGLNDPTNLSSDLTSTGYYPDKAIFDTRSEDPGNLLDLGFRMVLFPGILSGGEIVPDFSRPITSREVVIDPSVEEEQSLTIDYSEGLVHFSCPPPLVATGESDLKPNSLTSATSNPRGEMVLFASCIPYSQEKGQLGAGASIQAGLLNFPSLGLGNGSDVRPPLGALPEFRAIANQNIATSATGLRLEGFIYDLPQVGYAHLLDGSLTSFDYRTNYQTFWYSGISYDSITTQTILEKAEPVEGFAPAGGGANTLTTGVDGALVVLRRQAGLGTETPQKDTHYGTYFRTSQLTFEYADLTVNADGSVKILPTGVGGPSEELRSKFPLGSPEDKGRIYLDQSSQNWVVEGSPPFQGDYEIGMDITRGRLLTSMSLDFDESVFNFRRWWNVANSITPLSEDDNQAETPSKDYRIRFNFDAGGDFRAILPGLPFLPQNGAIDQGLCAMVEGATFLTVSNDELNGGVGSFQSGASVTGQRVVINLKAFSHRNESGGVYHDLVKKLDGGPANPVNWYAATMANGQDLGDTVALLNPLLEDVSTGLNVSPVAIEKNRMALTGRQISILPSKPYLKSKEISVGSPLTVDGGSRMILTVFSADPEFADRWVTLEFTPLTDSGGVAGVPVVYNDPDVLAGDLNQSFSGGVAGGKLDNAGFLEDFTGERSFLWVGPSDPRHPDGSDTIVLICGGHGSSNGSQNDFFNVMLEVGRTEEYGISAPAGRDLPFALGGDFLTAAVDKPRCGLFYGTSANTKPAAGPGIGLYTLANRQQVMAEGNVAIGFPVFGANPLGKYVGSFPIKNIVDVGGDIFDMVVELSIGDEHGGQGSGWTLPESSGLKDTPTSQDRLALRAGVSPDAISRSYMGRQMWPEKIITSMGNGLGTDEAGLKAIWVGYGTIPHDERGYGSQLLPQNTPLSPSGYQNFLIYAHAENISSSIIPYMGSSSLMRGDLVTGNVAPGVQRDGTEASWEGVVFEERTSFASDISSSDSLAFSILVGSRGYNPVKSSHLTGNVDPHIFGQLTFDDALSIVSDIQISVTPNPNTMTLSSAVKMLYPTLYGIESGGINPSVQGSSPEDGGGLDGGSSVGGIHASSNAILMGGGKAHFVSLMGPKAPASLAFSSSSSSYLTENQRFSTTFVEHGTFTAPLSLSSGGFLSNRYALESAGYADAFTPTFEDDTSSSLSRKRMLNPGQVTSQQSVGGISGLRFSGDTQVWFNDIKPFDSNGRTSALVLNSQALSEEIDLFGFGDSSFSDYFHQPSGYGPASSSFGHVQEATVLLMLTRHDMDALASALGKFIPSTGDLNFKAGNLENEGDNLFLMSQATQGEAPALPVPFLKGCYLKLGEGSFDNGTGSGNVGVWQIVGAPVLTRKSSVSNVINASIEGREDRFTPWVEARDDLGGRSKSSLASVLMVRISRYSAVPVESSEVANTFSGDVVDTPYYEGRTWGFYFDTGGLSPVYAARVMDPGGSPTGSPQGLSGITLNPGSPQNGFASYPMDLVSVFADTDETEKVSAASLSRARLFGIFETQDARGKKYSQAFFTFEQDPGISLSSRGAMRAIIYSSQREDRLDESSNANTQGEFAVDKAGRVHYVGHPSRLGLGVVIDGGLGLVQATAFRSTPQPKNADNIGSLLVFGHNAAYPTLALDGKSHKGVKASSTFNNAEFYENLTIASPKASLLFEDPFAAEGLGANLFRNMHALDRSVDAHSVWIRRSSIASSRHRRAFPNDTLFPDFSSGIKFRTPGSVVYERPFRSLDARGSSLKGAFTGKSSDSGIKGLEIPTHGECLLLPKGPSSYEKGSSYGVPDATPLTKPLIEFYNGPGLTPFGGTFGIIPSEVLSEKIAPSDAQGGYGALVAHTGNPGSFSAGYRHAHSREDGEWFGWKALSGSEFDRAEQHRILEGMVLEDIDNGTFYNLGSIGRWRTHSHGTHGVGVGQLGDGTRPPVLGGVPVVGGQAVHIVMTLVDHVSFSALENTGDPIATVAGVEFTPVSPGPPSNLQEFVSNSAAGNTDVDRAVTMSNLAGAITAYFAANPHPYYGSFTATNRRKFGLSATLTIFSEAFCSNKVILDDSSGADISIPILRGFNAVGMTYDKTPPGVDTDFPFIEGKEPEFLFDIGPQTDATLDLTQDVEIPLGDRVSNGQGRRPLKGHRFRVIPNVEFVPVLGPRDVDGSLYPLTSQETSIYPYADAIFSSFHHSFQGPSSGYGVGDIGKFLYLCGTDEYLYTGWWIILDVIENYSTPSGLKDVAVLRKWKRKPKNIEPDYQIDQLRGGLPLSKYRPPVLRMAADTNYNDAFYDTSVFHSQANLFAYSDLEMEIVGSDGNILYSITVPKADLVTAVVNDCVTFASFCNADSRVNGTDVPGGFGAFIVWRAITSPNHPRGVTVEVTYDLDSVLTDDADRDVLLGIGAILRVQFASNTQTPFFGGAAHGTTGLAPQSVGFYSYNGSNSQLDRGAGDRNNFDRMTVPLSGTPNVGLNFEGYSAANGIRWVFSHPLGEELVGSYLHLVRDQRYYFHTNTALGTGAFLESQKEGGDPDPPLNYWTSGYPRKGDSDAYRTLDIFRLNRCPTTNQIIVGGDCEIFTVGKGATQRPVMYSSLGVHGTWPDTTEFFRTLLPKADNVENTENLNSPVLYALQPIAREKIVTISPRNISSSVVLGRGMRDGVQGISGLVAQGFASAHDETYPQSGALNLEYPWKLVDFRSSSRVRINQHMVTQGVSTPTGDFSWDGSTYDADGGGIPGVDFGDAPFINNANNLAPLLREVDASVSTYTWSPAAEWWQLYWPEAYASTGQYDASSPRPSIKIDLTEAFTQATGPGSGPNSPYSDKTPCGVRLTKIMVNFGVWGNVAVPVNEDRETTPGYIPENGEINSVLDQMFASFNLIVEMPGGDTRTNSNTHTGTSGFPFGDRAPAARSTQTTGGFHIVPLYVNREAGDLMPNVMETFATVGPQPEQDNYYGTNPSAAQALQPDWAVGDYEYGFGGLPGGSVGADGLFASSYNPVIWGGMDFSNSAVASDRLKGLQRYSPFARSSRVSGLDIPMVADNLEFKNPNASSVCQAAKTGITVMHTAYSPYPSAGWAGGLSDQIDLPAFFLEPIPSDEAVKTCSHAFTIGLTPVSGTTTIDPRNEQPPYLEGWQETSRDQLNGVFRVGNWLDTVLTRGAYNHRSNSMLPPGARIFLEVTYGTGPGSKPKYGIQEERTITIDQDNIASARGARMTASGSWVGTVKCIFEVETADGTAFTKNVNILGESGD